MQTLERVSCSTSGVWMCFYKGDVQDFCQSLHTSAPMNVHQAQ